MKVEDVSAYEVLEKHPSEDLQGTVYLCRHKKTGARVALISNEDENKVFYIGFRTTPEDSTGVAHITEHSVLCGSRDFPVKDPFVELVKGSLNTFLNAMTYPDKTVYPVASCNDKDFQNLMHVYLDAVFFPNTYENEVIFRQEGWHYELDEAEELTINGVVYNEMKGVYSDPDSVLWTEIPAALYPHTTYRVDSGGDPEVIPELTYEQFLDFHRRYYHPSNSYIYLYGNMDMAEKLDYIDKAYLSKFDALHVDSEIQAEATPKMSARVVRRYPISEGENVEENTFLSHNYSVGDGTDAELGVAFKILDFALCTVPGAPLKQALIDAGIGKDVYSSYDASYRQPIFAVIAKGTSADKEQAFADTIQRTLQRIVKEGLDEKAILSAINHEEFKYREADFGTSPKGLMYGLKALDSWLYDDAKPFVHLEVGEVYHKLRKQAKEGYFEALIQKYLLDNVHCATVILLPEEGLQAKQEAAQRKALAAKKSSMSEKNLQDIRKMMERLDAFREKEDAPEDLAKIPLLAREDLKRETAPIYNEKLDLGGTPALFHEIDTNGIGYFRLMFLVKDIPESIFRYLGFLKNLYCNMNTKHFTYGELCNEINFSTGGIFVAQNNYGSVLNPDKYTQTVEVCAKSLDANLPRALELMEEMILDTDFSDEKRLKEILAEGNSKAREAMAQAGHVVAIGRALSYGNVKDAAEEELSGIAQYRFTCFLEEHFEEEKADLIQKLNELCKMIFRPENLMLDFTGKRETLEALSDSVQALKKKLHTEAVTGEAYMPKPEKKNEGFMTSGQVLYVGRAGNFKKKGLAYTGALRVLQVMLGYEYLWMNVRVKGGAYGVMCNFYRDGNAFFVSYRDPNLAVTNDVFEQAVDFVAHYEANERTMTQYIIGAISNLDVPLTAAGKGKRSREFYMSDMTPEMLQKTRDEVLDATPEDIRATAEYIRAFLSDDFLCVVGNEQKIKEEKDRFGKIENLF